MRKLMYVAYLSYFFDDIPFGIYSYIFLHNEFSPWTCWDQREDMDKEAYGNGDLSPPRTRQRSRQEADHSSPSVSNPGIVIGEPYSKRRKMDEAISPQITCSQEETGPISSQTVGKGKRPAVVSPLACTSEKRTETVSLQASSGDKRSQPLLPQIPLREKTPVQERIPNTTCLKEPKVEPGIGLLPKGSQSTDHHSGVLVKPKCEPFTGDEVPISVIHPQRPHARMNEGGYLLICAH